GKVYDRTRKGPPVFSPDSRRLAYGAVEGGRWLLVVEGQEHGPYDGGGEVAFSPDGRRLAYAGVRGVLRRPGAEWAAAPRLGGLVADGAEGPSFEGLGSGTLQFSPDGRRLAYGGMRGQQRIVVLDGIERAYSAELGRLVFSPDGRLAYVVREAERESVVIGQE